MLVDIAVSDCHSLLSFLSIRFIVVYYQLCLVGCHVDRHPVNKNT